jgi:hypothetical protein
MAQPCRTPQRNIASAIEGKADVQLGYSDGEFWPTAVLSASPSIAPQQPGLADVIQFTYGRSACVVALH